MVPNCLGQFLAVLENRCRKAQILFAWILQGEIAQSTDGGSAYVLVLIVMVWFFLWRPSFGAKNQIVTLKTITLESSHNRVPLQGDSHQSTNKPDKTTINGRFRESDNKSKGPLQTRKDTKCIQDRTLYTEVTSVTHEKHENHKTRNRGRNGRF